MQVGDMDDEVVECVAQAQLSTQPEENADGEHGTPAEAGGGGEDERRKKEKGDVKGQDVEQRRAVDEKDGADDGRLGMVQVEIQEVGQGSAVRMDGVDRKNGEGKRQQRHVVRVNLQGAAPEVGADAFLIQSVLAMVDAADQHGGEKDESFSGGDKPEGLVGKTAEMGREVDEDHPGQEHPAECIEFGEPL